MLDSSTHLLKTARCLVINPKDPPTWSVLAGHSRTVSDSIKSLITAIRLVSKYTLCLSNYQKNKKKTKTKYTLYLRKFDNSVFPKTEGIIVQHNVVTVAICQVWEVAWQPVDNVISMLVYMCACEYSITHLHWWNDQRLKNKFETNPLWILAF